jgi:tRNA A37 threonylcarbamoyladenosine dehydratase
MDLPDYQQRFGGIVRLYGVQAAERIRTAHVAVVGIGGVGSWAVEALARSGVGTLTLIDLDDICTTNTNRQLHTLSTTVGQNKVDVMADRARAIHPDIVVHRKLDFFTASSADTLLDGSYDVVIDAIDDVANKCRLIAMCVQRGLPVVTVGGAGGRLDPTAIEVADLSRSGGDGLLRDVRRTLRHTWGFAPSGAWGIPTVFSREAPRYPGADGEVCDRPDPSQTLRLDCASGFGTASFVTGTFGLVAAAEALRLLAAQARQSG